MPDKLVQDLEDDRVIIFCGAGISMGAGLPSYRGLVEHCYRELGRAEPKAKDKEWDWPDRMLGFLESRSTPDQVRKIVADRLNRPPSNLDMHKAILRLARLRNVEGTRLITTNFDTYFEQAGHEFRLGHDYHAGPILPIPRDDRASSWRSLVYLHGRLDEGANHQLVMTSADFGRAYLTEAWAARFVARLFADFTVLFIGYSLNDPVLRYMTDAFAAEDADARLGRTRGPAYIFTSYTGRDIPDSQPYLDRNLHPIFYHGMRHHLRLKRTLMAWADAREDYLANTARMIDRIAKFRPDAIDPTDTANLLWAVAGRPNDNGHGARVFSKVRVGSKAEPPPIEWLDVFEGQESERLAQHDREEARAVAMGAAKSEAKDADFALLFPSALDGRQLGLTPFGVALIPWLLRHLENEGFVRRVILKLERGRRPHAILRQRIRQRLSDGPALEPGYDRFWRIVSSEGDWALPSSGIRVGWSVAHAMGTHHESPWLKQELLSALRPSLSLKQALDRRVFDDPSLDTEPPQVIERVTQIADAEVVLADDMSLQSIIDAASRLEDPGAYWASLLDDLTSLLLRILDLYAVVGRADINHDPSVFSRPSIVPHDQNHDHQNWPILFDLIWLGWTRIEREDATAARMHVSRWRQLPYLSFGRLAAAAMSYSELFSEEEGWEVLTHV
ncbi:SIR2 family protein [Brevundimonas sp. MEB006b]|uniref:SIR2 family protein n=1 Tax=Brevundimonas sp. MEB006b TaxID=3040283 RepID=UPI002550D208|nr:SIR2 family protein [Brevundimonas sp. MEB006b]